MGWIIWGVVLPSCLAAAWLVLRKPLRQVIEELHVDGARASFRLEREWLEARFLQAMGRTDPIDRLRWEDAHWHDEVHWARDGQTRRLLALVEVHFDPDPDPAPFDEPAGPIARHATALFEYRRGRWLADGKRLDATRPADALVGHGRYQPVQPPTRPA